MLPCIRRTTLGTVCVCVCVCDAVFRNIRCGRRVRGPNGLLWLHFLFFSENIRPICRRFGLLPHSACVLHRIPTQNVVGVKAGA